MIRIFTLCLLLSVASAFGVTVTNVTVGPGKNYTSLAAAEDGEDGNGNLVSRDVIMQFECYAFEDTTAVTFDGWDTTNANYIQIYVPPGERHQGVWDANKYMLRASDAIALTIREGNVRVIGLQVESHSPTAHNRHPLWNGGNASFLPRLYFESVIVKGHGHATFAQIAFGLSSSSTVLQEYTAVNCLIINLAAITGNWGFQCYGVSGSSNVLYNCTAIGGEYSYRRQSGTPLAVNCISQGSVGGFTTGFSSLSSNNCSDITSDAPGSNPRTGTVTFVDSANGDFHLSASDTVARNYGADLSSTFTTDITGATRPGESVWDIGAFEYFPGGSSTPQTIISTGFFGQ